MKVCIMCGGEGTRLRPLTFERPKPCIPIVNRPSIQHLVSHLSNLGFREVVITLGYMGKDIEAALGDGSLFGVDITYVHEKTKLGTAGSVRNAKKYLDDQDFLIVGGDHVTDLNVLEFYRVHQKEKAMTTIGLISIDDPGEYGIAEIDINYEIKRFKEKPAPGEIFSNLASTGMYVCNPEIFDHIPAGKKFDFARDLFPTLWRRENPSRAGLPAGTGPMWAARIRCDRQSGGNCRTSRSPTSSATSPCMVPGCRARCSWETRSRWGRTPGYRTGSNRVGDDYREQCADRPLHQHR